MGKKPEITVKIEMGETRMYHRCPTCRRNLGFYEFGYTGTENGMPEERRIDCPICGEKIDWSDIPMPGEHDIWAGTYGRR